MLIKARRFFFLTLCMGTLSILFLGCSEKINVDAETSNQEEDPALLGHIHPTEEKDELEIQFSKISLISEEGIEIELDAALFQEKWSEYTHYLHNSSTIELKDSYTVVAWDSQNLPYVIQISTEGIKVGQDYYHAEKTLDPFISWMTDHIGIEYLNSLTLERMIIEARDLGIKKELSPQAAEDVVQLIKSSALVKGEPRLSSPLYPYYLINVEYKKDQFLQLIVLSPTLLSIKDGQNKWYYQLNNSIFSLLKEIIPITQFSEQHIKYLFQAEEIVITDGAQTISVNKHMNEALVFEMLVHQYARVFAQGRKYPQAPIEESSEIKYRFQFKFIDSFPQELTVYEHYYYYNEERYDLVHVSNKLKEIIDSTNDHK